MDDAPALSWPTEELSPGDGHRPRSSWDGAEPSTELMSARVARLLADGKTVTVIHTSTKAVVGTVTTDENPGLYQYIAVGANGTLYVTDYYGGTVYAVVVGNPQL